jgi:hypothetical protein
MRKLITAGAIAASVALGSAVPAGAASATSAPAGGHAQREYCAIEIMPVQPGQPASRAVSRTCSDRHAKGSDLPLGLPAASAHYDIITFYQFTNYQGNVLDFYSTAPCSASGSFYTIDDTRPSDNHAGSWGISSWQAHSNCWHTEIFYGYNLGTPGYLYAQGVWEAGYIGAPWDNHVWSAATGYS